MGSENDILEAAVQDTRERISMEISRKRREFGAAFKLSDKDSQELWNSSQMECRPFKDPNFELKRLEHDIGIQAISECSDKPVQATHGPLKQGGIQYKVLILYSNRTSRGMS